MPKIESWDKLPALVRQHLIERMRDRDISIADLHQLRLWIESRPEVPIGNWCKDFGPVPARTPTAVTIHLCNSPPWTGW